MLLQSDLPGHASPLYKPLYLQLMRGGYPKDCKKQSFINASPAVLAQPGALRVLQLASCRFFSQTAASGAKAAPC